MEEGRWIDREEGREACMVGRRQRRQGRRRKMEGREISKKEGKKRKVKETKEAGKEEEIYLCIEGEGMGRQGNRGRTSMRKGRCKEMEKCRGG